MKRIALFICSMLLATHVMAATYTITTTAGSGGPTLGLMGDGSGNALPNGGICGSTSATLYASCVYQAEVNSSGQLSITCANCAVAGDATITGPTGGPITTANNFSTGLQVSNWQNGRVTLTGTATAGSILSWSGFSGWNSGILECTGAGTQGTNRFEVDVMGATGGTVPRRVAVFTGPTASIPINLAGETFVNVVADVWSAGAPTCTLRGTVNQSVPDDYAVSLQADATAPINLSSASTTAVVQAVNGLSIYVMSWNAITSGTTNLTWEYGTQTTNPCDTGTTVLTGPYPLASTTNGAAIGGSGLVLTIPPGNQLCAINSAAIQVSGSLAYTRR